jgi:hypothetical protein
MTERQILFDAVNVGWSEERRLSQRAPALGVFALKQMAPACPSEQDLAARGYFETFGHRLPGFNAFGASHIHSLSFSRSMAESIRRLQAPQKGPQGFLHHD